MNEPMSFARLRGACALLALAAAFLPNNSATQSPTPALPSRTLEIPTLVVDHEHRPVGDLRADQFRVKIDDHAEFAPLDVHMEDKEPVSLSILIDASRDSYHDLPQMGDDLASIASTMFLPQDRLTIYALDCAMARALYNATPTPDAVRQAVKAAFSSPKLHDQNASPACGKAVHLWDNIAAAVATLSKLPGRRVLLVVTSGHDGGSKYDWQTVVKYAQDQDVAIFGLRDQRQMDADTEQLGGFSVTRSTGAGNTISPPAETRNAISFELLCANAGGLILNALPLHRNETLAYVLFIIRHRLILTIPAEGYAATASHTLKVTIPHTPYFVSAAGIGEPQASTP